MKKPKYMYQLSGFNIICPPVEYADSEQEIIDTIERYILQYYDAELSVIVGYTDPGDMEPDTEIPFPEYRLRWIQEKDTGIQTNKYKLYREEF